MPIVARGPNLDRVEWKMVGDRGVVFCKTSGMVWANVEFDRVSNRAVAKRMAQILNHDPTATRMASVSRFMRLFMMEEQINYDSRHAPRGPRR